MKKLFLICCFWMVTMLNGYAQLKVYSFEEVAQLSQVNPKPIVVFVHTSWCKFCKMMEQTTFKNKKVIEELNQRFYFVSLDAETRNAIWFNDHLFQFKPTGTTTGVHELATALATINGIVSYPTLSILDTELSIVFQKNAYLDAKTVLLVLAQFNH
ncbi:DUF255 domain-containing protein [Flavobacterium sp. NG2]|uniref:thioredoxin family protein n=1 Tax=Flavobacterium sp. NG2 TaxID=3097547 RepID=UPI002A818845|nr:thioredoxin fold domain-containing protein [Flavobacterium sp. NG2]WPR72179.1 DUF255 domain-containing protein [Flavobacterium sp. NG2]